MQIMSYKYIPYTFSKSNNDSGYFDLRPAMSYGTKVIIVVGARRIGKTAQTKKLVINKTRYSDTAKFAWLRDNDEARKKLASNNGAKFFSDCKKLGIKNLNGTIEGEVIKLDGKPCGYLMPSSTFQNYKGNDFDDIKWIVFDEFIAEKNVRHNGNRAWEIINMIYTIASTRNDVRIIFLANALDRGDPILEFFGIKVKDFGIYLNREKSVVLHYCDNSPEFNKARDTSVMGKLIKGTQYEANLFNNQFADDEQMFFDKRPPKCKLLCILHNYSSSIRLYLKDGVLYVCHDFNISTNPTIRYVNDLELTDTKHHLIPKTYLDAIKQAFITKRAYFENAFCKTTFIDIIKNR